MSNLATGGEEQVWMMNGDLCVWNFFLSFFLSSCAFFSSLRSQVQRHIRVSYTGGFFVLLFGLAWLVCVVWCWWWWMMATTTRRAVMRGKRGVAATESSCSKGNDEKGSERGRQVLPAKLAWGEVQFHGILVHPKEQGTPLRSRAGFGRARGSRQRKALFADVDRLGFVCEGVVDAHLWQLSSVGPLRAVATVPGMTTNDREQPAQPAQPNQGESRRFPTQAPPETLALMHWLLANRCVCVCVCARARACVCLKVPTLAATLLVFRSFGILPS